MVVWKGLFGWGNGPTRMYVTGCIGRDPEGVFLAPIHRFWRYPVGMCASVYPNKCEFSRQQTQILNKVLLERPLSPHVDLASNQISSLCNTSLSCKSRSRRKDPSILELL